MQTNLIREHTSTIQPDYSLHRSVLMKLTTKTCSAYDDFELNQPAHMSHRKRIHIFRVVGQFIAKAMLDSRIIDVSLNKIFLKLVLGETVPLSLDNLKVRVLFVLL